MRSEQAVAPLIAPRHNLHASVFAALLSVVPMLLDAATQTSVASLYEQRFTRGTGAPIVQTATVSIKNFQPPFTLHVINGPNGAPRVSSASIWLNGRLLLKPSDFSKPFAAQSIPVSLTDPTEVRVELKSEPGSALAITIDGTPAPEPLLVSYDEAHRVSQSIDPAVGAQIAWSDSGGHAFTLEIPPAALSGVASQTITVTPISAIDNLPAPLRFTAGVRLEPHGLFFSKPAKLRVFIPDLTTSPGLAAIYRAGADRGYHFYPIESVNRATSTVSLWLSSFSDISLVVQQILANCTLQGSCATSTCEPYEIYQQAATCALQPVVDCQLISTSCPTTTPDFVTVMTEWYQEVVMPAINGAQTQDEFERASQELLRWTSPLQGLGVDDTDPFKTMIETARAVLAQRLCTKVTDLSQQCSAADACSKRPLMQEGLNLIAFAQSALAVADFGCADIAASFCSNWASLGAESIEMVTAPSTLRQGDHLQVAVKLLNAMHQEISKPVTWDTENAAVATVSSSGYVTAVGPGTTIISAKVDCALAMVSITVEAGMQAYVGEQVWFSVSFWDPAVPQINWTSSGPAVNCPAWSTNGAQQCCAVQEGTAMITAADAKGNTNHWAVTVGPRIAAVAVAPATADFYLPWDGFREYFFLHATTPRGCELWSTCSVWRCDSSDTAWSIEGEAALITERSYGSVTVTPVSAGIAQLSGTIGGITGTASINVHEGAMKVRVSPMPAFVSPGQRLQLSATAQDRNGNDVPGCSFSWTVWPSNGPVSVDSAGSVTAVLPEGNSRVTATIAGQCPQGNPYSNRAASGTAVVYVVPFTSSPNGTFGIVSVPDSIAIGSIAFMMPTWFDTAGNAVVTAGNFTLTSLTPGVGTIENVNALRGMTAGTAIVEGSTYVGLYDNTYQYASARKAIAVFAASALNVTPDTATVPAGSTVRLTATLVDANGLPLALATASNPLGATIAWSTNNPAVATITPQPVEGTSPTASPTISPVVVTGVATGTATITASGGGLQRSATVTVNVAGPEPTAITVTPTSASIDLGHTVQLQAVVTDANGNPIPNAQVGWTADPPTIATVSPAGLVTGVSAGSAVVTAASGNVHASATITVQPPASGTMVSGIVYYSTTPQVGLKVELTAPDYATLSTTTTDAVGRFEFGNVAPGSYLVFVTSSEGFPWGSTVTVGTTPSTVVIYVPKNITLSSPANGTTVDSLHPTLTWLSNPEAVGYYIQINETAGWALVETGLVGAVTSYTLKAELKAGTSYTWRVDAWDVNGHTVGQTRQSFTFTIAAPNQAGGALSFNGINNLVTVPHHSSLNLQDLTIEAWVNFGDPTFFPPSPTPPFNRETLVSKGANFGNYTLSALSSRTVEFVLQTSGGNYSCCGAPVLSASVWTHIAVTYSSATGTTHIYVNGSPAASGTGGPVPITNADALTIGSLFEGLPGHFFNGVMDDVRIWNVVRSASDIAQNYDRSVDPATPGLVAYWKFDESSGQTVVSSTGNNNGVLGANATVAYDDPTRVASTAPIVP